jgi:hypothetical protein
MNPILRHSVVGPFKDGAYRVVYQCDHTKELTCACEATSKQFAEQESIRLNEKQIAKELAIQEERRLCGFRRIL